MKFIKSSFAQKLIIVLIAIIIFNIAVPKTANAWDLGGILLKPITSFFLSILLSIDLAVGSIVNGISVAVTGLGTIIEAVSDMAQEMGNSYVSLDAPMDKVISVYVENPMDKRMQLYSWSVSQFFVGPDTIFSGSVELLDANIFNTTTTDLLSDLNLMGTIKKGIAVTYKTLRDICGYIMLAGLIFTGIRILISSNIPSKKMQWLMLLEDWLMGMFLLIFSHVIMVVVFWISDTIVAALAKGFFGFGGLNYSLALQCMQSFDSAEQIITLVMLGYMIYLTIVFAFSYFKRVIWVCLLVVIAPITSIMYAFGQQTKSIYGKWLREYIMTVFIQPFHMIIYFTLVSIPLNMVNSTGEFDMMSIFNGYGSIFTMFYALFAISMIRPAEKYFRNLFGFDQGVAGMASFDSGKQTLIAIKQLMQKITQRAAKEGTKVLTVAGTAVGAYFGGPMGAQLGAKLGQTVGKMGEQQVKEQGQKSDEKEKMMNNAIDSRCWIT